MTRRILLADKPAGVTTHSSLNERDRTRPLAETRDGFVEHLEDRVVEAGSRLFVCHRLDRDTTGAIAFAADAEAAASLQELFAERAVEKRYLFLTDRASQSTSFEVESCITRRGSSFVSEKPSTTSLAGARIANARIANARTRFELLTFDHGVGLWEARPETGKPHQIRLHAESAGLPILGDPLHGGSRFPALCLHSQELRFDFEGETIHHSAPPPIWFERRELVGDPELVRWLAAVDRRERLLRSQALSCRSRDLLTLRWIHDEGDPLRAEQLGETFWLSWYGEHAPSSSELQRIEKLAGLLGWQRWYLQLRGNRGRTPNDEWRYVGPSALLDRWVGEENGMSFEFRADQGLSPGLFLDQRRNRAWVHAQARGRTVLNLFCYTGGFSVAAALGGAAKVVSVDLSRNFLDWTKSNFSLNSLPLETHEFRAMDARDYLSWARKKGLTFDLVVCDPPSFGRSKSGVFSIEKDYADLIDALLAVTAPGGRILFSSNFERWTLEEFSSRATLAMRERRWLARLESTPAPDWDFERPLEPRKMKSFFISRD